MATSVRSFRTPDLAAFVKVVIRNLSISTPSLRISCFILSTRTAVLPDPAAAATSMFLFLRSMACCCSLVHFIVAILFFFRYSWKSSEFNLKIDYWPHKGIYFFRNSQETNSTATALTLSDGYISIENDSGTYAKYDNNIWEYTINTYGDDNCCWFWYDNSDDDTNDIDDIGEVKTQRGIILGESTKSDVIAAYGESDMEMSFDKTTDILYLSMKAAEESSYKYLDDTRTVLAYNYEDQYQIVFYINDIGAVDFILYTSGIWYED